MKKRYRYPKCQYRGCKKNVPKKNLEENINNCDEHYDYEPVDYTNPLLKKKRDQAEKIYYDEISSLCYTIKSQHYFLTIDDYNKLINLYQLVQIDNLINTDDVDEDLIIMWNKLVQIVKKYSVLN